MTAARIRRLRVKTLGLSQQAFAVKVGASRRTVQGWEAESNPHKPSPMALKELERLEARYEGPP